MTTRLAESPGRPLERHGNVSPREMTVHGVPERVEGSPGQNPAYRPAHSPTRSRTDDDGPAGSEEHGGAVVAFGRQASGLGP